MAQAQEDPAGYQQKLIEIEKKLDELEQLKQDLLQLKDNLVTKEQTLSKKEKELETRIQSQNPVLSKYVSREAEPDTKWHLAGYADAGFEAVSGGKNDSFVAGKFNPAFHFQYKDWLIFEAEMEIETSGDGETEIALEYSQLDFLLHDNVTLVVGKYLSPIGQFQERLHPSWINRSMNAPAGFGHGGAQPTSDVGFQLRGGVPANDFIFTYSLAVGNGPRFGHDEDELELEGFGEDNDGNKSIGGRVAVVHSSSFEVGFSYLDAALNEEAGIAADGDIIAAKNGDYRLWGVDGAYAKGPWDVRFEYLNAKVDPRGESAVIEEDGHGALEKTTWESWYAQVAYRLSDVSDNPIIGKFEPVFRYGEFRVKIDDALLDNSEKRWNVGLNYWLAPTIAVKTGIERRNFILAERPDETRYKLQFAYGF
ncbi:porin [Luteithermobacter gelatinilyticus]|uniref:porin n=1 Tax=Luteithermobacter gelatinilyticus TaxID=2582913 RepID=UPI00143D8515|nr:porin [Luteithermobacter gelatinilyticus]